MTRPKGPRLGRPPLGKVTVRVNLKVDEGDRERWHAAATKQGLTLSEWLRDAAESHIRAKAGRG